MQIATDDTKELYAIRNYSLRCFNSLVFSLRETFNIFEASERLDFGELASHERKLARLGYMLIS